MLQTSARLPYPDQREAAWNPDRAAGINNLNPRDGSNYDGRAGQLIYVE